MKTYKFYFDAGHGWLAVKRSELVALGILDKVTHYSYQRGATVYLEEDCDAYLFISTVEKAGGKVNYTEKTCYRSPIRSYDSFKAN